MKRIALFTDGIFPYVIGGMQKHSYYLAKFLAKKKIHVDLYHMNPSDLKIDTQELFTEEENEFIHSIIIPFPLLPGLPGHYIRASYLYSCSIYNDFLKRPPVDFVYTKGFSGWKFIEEKKKKGSALSVPVGVNFHGYEMFQKAPSFMSWLKGVLFLKKPVEYITTNADCVFSYGGSITEIIKGLHVPDDRIIEVPTGIEKKWLNDNVEIRSGKTRFVFVGRYERRKGIEELSAVLKGFHPLMEFEFHFVGNIPLNKRVNSNSIIYHGNITEASKMKELLRTCDILVCPSHSEGMPNVIMEAMASGLAVIATDVGAVREMVTSSIGFLIQPGSKRAILTALNDCLELEPTTLNQMKKEAVEKVRKKFLWEDIIDRTVYSIDGFIETPARNERSGR
jgi:glycosyltransferase involved in cell wall biosynthesis